MPTRRLVTPEHDSAPASIAARCRPVTYRCRHRPRSFPAVLRKIRPQEGARRIIFDYGLTARGGRRLGHRSCRRFVVKPYLIPSTSMANTLVPGQRVLVDRLVYRFRPVHRGDIIVYRRPEAPQRCPDQAGGGPTRRSPLAARRAPLRQRRAGGPISFVDKAGGLTEPTQPADPYASSQPERALVAGPSLSACPPAATS